MQAAGRGCWCCWRVHVGNVCVRVRACAAPIPQHLPVMLLLLAPPEPPWPPPYSPDLALPCHGLHCPRRLHPWVAPAPGWVLRHTWVGPFREDPRRAPSSPFWLPARGGSGALRCLEHLPWACRVQPRSSLPAGMVPGMMLATMGTDPAGGAGLQLLPLPRTGRAVPFPAIPLLPFTESPERCLWPQGAPHCPGQEAPGAGCSAPSRGRARELPSGAQLPPSATASPTLLHLHLLPTTAPESRVTPSPELSWETRTPLQTSAQQQHREQRLQQVTAHCSQ